MKDKLKCFISSSNKIDLTRIKKYLCDIDVDVIDVYDISIGESLQQSIKKKIKQADFSIFFVSEFTPEIVYEMGVCEGIGKPQFVVVNENQDVPLFVKNQLFMRSDFKDFKNLEILLGNIKESIKNKYYKSRKPVQIKVSKIAGYSDSVIHSLNKIKNDVQKLRHNGTGKELEKKVESIFQTIHLNYVENSSNQDKGADFALWSDQLGKLIGNPIILEVKYGTISPNMLKKAEVQLNNYIKNTDAKVAILLYLDKNGNRVKFNTTLSPLIFSYDIEDFITDLIASHFEQVIIEKRNKIAHGIY